MNWHQQNRHGAGHEAAFDPYAGHTMVADQAVDAKLEFIRKTYGWLMYGIAVGALVATASFWLFTTNTALLFSVFSPPIWLGVMVGGMILTGFVVGRAMMNPQTATFGLFFFAALEGLIFGPLLALAYFVAGAAAGTVAVSDAGVMSGGGFQIIWQALILTGVVFSGLSAYVFLTKQDFSFLRGALVVISMVFMGVILVYMLGMAFGWNAGGGTFSLAIAASGILLASGWILYDTSQILHKFTGAPGEEKVAALALLQDLALLLWYVLILLINLYGRE